MASMLSKFGLNFSQAWQHETSQGASPPLQGFDNVACVDTMLAFRSQVPLTDLLQFDMCLQVRKHCLAHIEDSIAKPLLSECGKPPDKLWY